MSFVKIKNNKKLNWLEERAQSDKKRKKGHRSTAAKDKRTWSEENED